MRLRGYEKDTENLSCRPRTRLELQLAKPKTYTRLLSIRASRRWGMSFLSEVQLGDKFSPFVAFQEALGFIPNLLRAQTLLPRVSRPRRSLKVPCV